jgi:uncharacterized protein YggE
MLQTQPELKKALVWGVLVLAVCATLVITAVVIARRPLYVQYNTGVDGKPVNNISVNAVGKVSVTPDLVTFVATYEAKNQSLSALQADLTSHNNSIVKALKDMGIEEKDIQTTNFSLQPNYYYTKDTWEQVQDGHTGSVSVQVKVRDVSKAGKVVDSTVDAGASTISSLTFTVDDMTKAKSDARVLATKAAHDKAKELADGSNVGLGGLISISESSSEVSPSPYYSNLAKDSVEASGVSTDLSAGSLEITISVEATYGIQ